MNKKISQKLQKPWTQLWPENDLESVSQCPVCDENKRKLLHADLVDDVFRVAPGKWNMWQCDGCGSGYLDPRPTEASIGQAYKAYYTHNAGKQREDSDQLGRLRLFRRGLANGYLNDRYGTQYQPANRLGALLVGMIPSQREALDVQFRWLPKPEAGQQLLDVGCGNGEFLLNARDAGWQVIGIDPDPNAVKTTQQLGLEAKQGSINLFDRDAGLFDVITVSHVIEHVHKPGELLAKVQKLLRPGGTLYLETPNIQSFGARIFGPNWRGIETPRHLAIFSINGLQELLRRYGFVEIKLKHRRKPIKNMFHISHKLMQGLPVDSAEPKLLPVGLSLHMNTPFLPVSRLEFITLIARKK